MSVKPSPTALSTANSGRAEGKEFGETQGMPHSIQKRFRKLYAQLKKVGNQNLYSTETSRLLLRLPREALRFLGQRCQRVGLESPQGKHYFSYAPKRRQKPLSRPINEELFLSEYRTLVSYWKNMHGQENTPDNMTKLFYTMTSAYAAVVDLYDRNNKKVPATYFEYLIGHLFAKIIGQNPRKSFRFQTNGREARMTMDYLFNLYSSEKKLHLSVKMSTRERVVQTWAHQRLLEAVFGPGECQGLLVVLTETKLNLQKRQVTEICVPDQWLVYQKYLAPLARVYYLDLPVRYQRLENKYVTLASIIKPFDYFFSEREAIFSIPSPPV
jgi:hypothetical protein